MIAAMRSVFCTKLLSFLSAGSSSLVVLPVALSEQILNCYLILPMSVNDLFCIVAIPAKCEALELLSLDASTDDVS